MADANEILNSPEYQNANEATKQAIFDKHVANDPEYAKANEQTKAAIHQRFGLEKATTRKDPMSVEGMADMQKALLGESGTDLGTGISAEIAKPIYGLGQMAEKAITGSDTYFGNLIKQENAKLDAAKQRSPIGTMVGQGVGMVAPAVATFGESVMPSLIGSAGVGAVMAAAQPVQPGMDTKDYWLEKAKQASMGSVGGVLFHGLGSLGAKMLDKFAAVEPSAPQIAARTKADALGFETTPTMAARKTTAIDTNVKNIDHMTELVTKETGQATKNVSNEWLDTRFKDVGNQLDNIFKDQTFKLDKTEIAPKLKQFLDLEKQLPSTVKDTRTTKVATDFLNQFKKKDITQIDGPTLHTMYKRLGEMGASRDASRELKELTGDLRDTIKTTIEKQLGTDTREEFGKLNQQWQATLALRESNAVDARTNKISGDKLGDWINKQPRPSQYGSKDLRDLGDVGQKLGIGTEGQLKKSYAEDIATKAGRTRNLLHALVPAKERLYQQYAKGVDRNIVTPSDITLLGLLAGREDSTGNK